MKGVAFRSVLASLTKLRGENARNAALEAMSDELRTGFNYHGIVAGGWYPVALYKDLLRAIRDSTREGTELVFEIGRQCTEDDLRGVYRFVAKVISPETLFSLSRRLFSSYYSVGEVDLVESRTGFTHARWVDCAEFDENMWTEIMGSSVELLSISGAKHIRGRVVAGGKDGDAAMEATAHWS